MTRLRVPRNAFVRSPAASTKRCNVVFAMLEWPNPNLPAMHFKHYVASRLNRVPIAPPPENAWLSASGDGSRYAS